MKELAPGELTFLRTRIDSALARGGFGVWEKRFLQDMRVKLGRPRPCLSEKQSRKLHSVLNNSVAPQRGGLRHHPARSRRKSPSAGHRVLRGMIFLAVIVLFFGLHQLFLALYPPASSSPPASAPIAVHAPSDWNSEITSSIRVIDGDTVDVEGERFRLVGLNTPETVEPRCAAERTLGMQAKERLQQLLAGGTARLTRVACACPPGTAGTKQCNYGRSCGVLSVNGQDVADTLVREGLAAAFHCGATSCPPLPRPWCE